MAFHQCDLADVLGCVSVDEAVCHGEFCSKGFGRGLVFDNADNAGGCGVCPIGGLDREVISGEGFAEVHGAACVRGPGVSGWVDRACAVLRDGFTPCDNLFNWQCLEV